MAGDTAQPVRPGGHALTPTEAPGRIPGNLVVREDDGFFTVRLKVAGLRVDYRDGVLELKLPKR